MNSSERVLAGLVCLCLLAMACVDADAENEPRPRRLVPGWGLNTEPVAGVIEGDNFLTLVTQHVGGPEPVTVESRFEAFLGEVRLEDVTLEDAHTVRVRIPRGLTPGLYPLMVVDPLGRRVELPGAYYASDVLLASLEARAAWEPASLWVGQKTRLRLTVRNTGGTAARAVTPVLQLEEGSGAELLSVPPPATLAPGESRDFDWELRAESPGEPRFRLEIQGREERTDRVLQTPSMKMEALRIREAAPLSTALTVSPSRLNPSQQIRLSLRVTNSTTGAPREVVLQEPRLEGGGKAVLLSGPGSSRMLIPVGEAREFTWTYRATAPGLLSFRVEALEHDVFTDREVALPEARADEVTVQTPGALVARFITLPPSINLGQAFDVELELSNTGGSPVHDVMIEAAGVLGSGLVSLVSGPEPGSLDLPGQGKGVFRARLKATGRGTCVLHAGARGRDVTDGVTVVAPTVASSAVLLR